MATESSPRRASPWRLLLALPLMAGTLSAADPAAYSAAVSGLDSAQNAEFRNGEAEFRQRWVVPFHIGGQWGRGPLSNGEACSDCHAANGRGRAPDHEGMPMQSMLVRLSIPGAAEDGGPLAHPVYGIQLQSIGVLGKVPEEGRARVRYSEQKVTLEDGEIVSLRKPQFGIHNLRYGALEPEVMLSARVAQPVFGMGLLEAVPDSVLIELAQTQKQAGRGGRTNLVFDPMQGRKVIGRFGHKANQPSLPQQVATALVEDLGVTSRLFPVDNCTTAQSVCGKVPSVGTLELSDARFQALLFYLRAVSPPERRDRDNAKVMHGEKLFEAAGCGQCHVPSLRTGDAPLAALANRTIHPYTDLLLHDMGEGLSDGRPDFGAGPRDWRTAPLWGIGLSGAVNGNATYLHDGRARTLIEAIVWHGGEAQSSRDAFVAMQRQEREALLAFLASL